MIVEKLGTVEDTTFLTGGDGGAEETSPRKVAEEEGPNNELAQQEVVVDIND